MSELLYQRPLKAGGKQKQILSKLKMPGLTTFEAFLFAEKSQMFKENIEYCEWLVQANSEDSIHFYQGGKNEQTGKM